MPARLCSWDKSRKLGLNLLEVDEVTLGKSDLL